MLVQNLLSRRRIHQLIHQPQPGHRVFRVAHRFAIARRNLRLRKSRRQRRSTHQERDLNPRSPQIARRDHHLLRAFHQQPRKPDRIRMMLQIRLDQFFRRHFDAQIHHVIPVVFQNNLNKIFPDVVHIALHRRQHNLSALRRIRLLHKLFEMIHRSLHGLRRLQHLGHDQFIRIKQPPDFRHPGHQWTVDDVQRRGPFGAFPLQIGDQSVARPFDDVIRQPLVERQVRCALFFSFFVAVRKYSAIAAM